MFVESGHPAHSSTYRLDIYYLTFDLSIMAEYIPRIPYEGLNFGR